MKRIILFAALLLSTITQAQQIRFEASYLYTPMFAQSSGLCETADKGFALAAYYHENGYSYSRIIKTDSLGQVDWVQTYGTSAMPLVVRAVAAVPSGGYILCGNMDSTNLYPMLALIRTDGLGNVLWCRKYGTSTDSLAENTEAAAVRVTFDGGFVVAGTVVGSDYNMNILKTDSLGQLEWMNQYCIGEDKDRGFDIQQLPDSGFVACAKSMEYNQGQYEGAYVLRVDKKGRPIWGRGLGAFQESARSIVIAPDGGIVVTGFTRGMGFGQMDVLLFKLDTSGTLLWTRAIGDAGNQQAYSVALTNDGGFVITGGSGPSYEQPFMLFTDSVGNLLDAKLYPQTFTGNGTQVIQTTDGGFAASLFNYNVQTWAGPVILLKTDSAGVIDCDLGGFNLQSMQVTPQLSQGFTYDSLHYSYPIGTQFHAADSIAMWYHCENDAAIVTSQQVLCTGGPAYFSNVADSGSYWYVNNILADSTLHFDTTFTTPGTYIVSLITVPGNDTSFIQVHVFPSPVVSLFLPDTICITQGNVPLYNYVSPSTGYFSGSILATGDSFFDPIQAGLGMHTIYYTVYAWGAICPGVDSQLVYVVDCLEGLGADYANAQFQLWPNPIIIGSSVGSSTGDVQFTFPSAGDRIIRLYEPSGRLLQEQRTVQQQHTLDLSDCAAGLYFVTVVSEDGVSSKRLLVVR